MIHNRTAAARCIHDFFWIQSRKLQAYNNGSPLASIKEKGVKKNMCIKEKLLIT
jgi:hypothetical protein